MFRAILLVGLLVAVENSTYGQSELIRNPDGSYTSTSVYMTEPKERTTFRVWVIDPKLDDTGYYAKDQSGLFMTGDPKPKPDGAVYTITVSQFYAWKKNMQKWADKNKYDFKEAKDKDVYFISGVLTAQMRAEKAKEAAKKERNPFAQPQTQVIPPQFPPQKMPQVVNIPQQQNIRPFPQEDNPQPSVYVPPVMPSNQRVFPQYTPPPCVPPQPVVAGVIENPKIEPDWWADYKNGSIIVGVISIFLLVIIVIIKVMKGD